MLNATPHQGVLFFPVSNLLAMTRSLLSVLACALFAFAATAQDSYTDKVQQYIDKYKDVAVAEMQRSGIPASITLAQGILESGVGESELATKGNNHFGIKCHDGWEGKTMTYDDDKKDECFRCYADAEESFRDHSDFLRTRERYAFLFEYSPTDYKKWANGLKDAGYATNPKYPELLITNIEKYDLHQYDVYENFVADNSTSTKSSDKKHNKKEHKGLGDVLKSVEDAVAPTTANTSERIVLVNQVRAVRVKQNETLEQIARSYDLGVARLLKYNEMPKVEKLPEGSIVFLQPKRRFGNDLYHVVQTGETMHSISQQHGIRLDYLYAKNNMQLGTQPAVGEVMYMRDKRSTIPRLSTDAAPVATQKETPSDIATIGTRSANTTPSEDASPRYAKPMQTDPLFPPSGNSSVEQKQETIEAENDLVETPQNEHLYTEEQPIPTSPDGPMTASTQTEPSADYITSQEQEGLDYYTVKPKDTLYSIAKAYGLSVNELMEINQLGSNVISVGSRLRIRR